jgi:hypothetical protein
MIYSVRMPEFLTVLRGYEKRQVDEVLTRALNALEGGSADQRNVARESLRSAQFEVALRGYDRTQVDGAVQGVLRQLEGMAATDELRVTLTSVLRMSRAGDQELIAEVRRLRELADQHNF